MCFEACGFSFKKCLCSTYPWLSLSPLILLCLLSLFSHFATTLTSLIVQAWFLVPFLAIATHGASGCLNGK